MNLTRVSLYKLNTNASERLNVLPLMKTFVPFSLVHISLGFESENFEPKSNGTLIFNKLITKE